MSIAICFRPPAFIHSAQEATLGTRANRANRTWWQRMATYMSVAEADAEIKAKVASCFDEDFSYGMDMRNLGTELVLVKGGIGETFAMRDGEEIIFIHQSGGGHLSDWTWRIGAPPMDYWMTADKLRVELQEIVARWRLDYFLSFLELPARDAFCWRHFSDEEWGSLVERATAARDQAIAFAQAGAWQECHATLDAVRFPPTDWEPRGGLVFFSASYHCKKLTGAE